MQGRKGAPLKSHLYSNKQTWKISLGSIVNRSTNIITIMGKQSATLILFYFNNENILTLTETTQTGREPLFGYILKQKYFLCFISYLI